MGTVNGGGFVPPSASDDNSVHTVISPGVSIVPDQVVAKLGDVPYAWTVSEAVDDEWPKKVYDKSPWEGTHMERYGE